MFIKVIWTLFACIISIKVIKQIKPRTTPEKLENSLKFEHFHSLFNRLINNTKAHSYGLE